MTDSIRSSAETLQNIRFTYPGWQDDLKSIEEELHESMIYFGIHHSNVKDTNSHRKMINKQQLFDGTCTDENIRRLRSNEFTYPDYENDKNNIMNKFREGLPIENYMTVLEMKQRLNDGNLSHPLLRQLATAVYSYDGWNDDMKEAERFLFDLDISTFEFGSREELAKQQLTKMQKKQDIVDGICSDSNLEILNTGSFTYPNFGRDRQEVMGLIDDKWSLDQGLRVIQIRQAIHEGNSSTRVLASLEENYFTYDGWQDDKREVKQILLEDLPMAMFESAESKAWRKLQGMENKQRMHDGCDPIGEILNSSLFTYPKFDTDRRSAIEDHFEGLNITDKVKSMLFQQEVHNGDRSHPVLCAIDRAVVQGRCEFLPDTENTPPSSMSLTTSSKQHSLEKRSGKECVICLENKMTHVFVPCGHLALCSNCACRPAYSTSSKKIRCPICRKKSAMVMKVYGA